MSLCSTPTGQQWPYFDVQHSLPLSFLANSFPCYRMSTTLAATHSAHCLSPRPFTFREILYQLVPTYRDLHDLRGHDLNDFTTLTTLMTLTTLTTLHDFHDSHDINDLFMTPSRRYRNSSPTLLTFTTCQHLYHLACLAPCMTIHGDPPQYVLPAPAFV